MGYYTRHELEIIEGDDYRTDYESEICDIAEYRSLFGGDTVKWYDSEKDMKKYSRNHPKTLFLITGEGEEAGDLWKAYFKNGKMQVCKAKITFDNFNENEMQ